MRAFAFDHPRTLTIALSLTAIAPAARAADVRGGARARSAFKRVGVPEEGKPGALVVAADLDGGVTEALSDADSAHARIAAGAAAAVDVTRFLNLGVWVGGRYDRHPKDERGRDDGFLLESELSARLAWRLGAMGLGIEGTAWVPGGDDVGSSLAAVGADGKLLVSGHTRSLVVAGSAGYRVDRSRGAVADPARLRFGDRSALGVSDYDALLLGLGAGYLAGKTTLFAEAAAQLLLESPKVAASPMWLTLGVRRPLGPSGLSGELSLTGLASARPDLNPAGPLFPIEPRFALGVGLRYRFGEAPEPAPSRAAPPVPVIATPPPAPAPPPPSSIDLALLDDRGQPLTRARVIVTQNGREVTLVETEPGHYRLDDATPGPAHLRAEADNFKPIERDIELSQGRALRLDARAELALPPGQVRGLVRSFRGRALSANIHLEPGGVESKTDGDGFFQVDVPPGEYEVVIEAPGYQPQRRKAKVEQQGVVIVNADLVQKK